LFQAEVYVQATSRLHVQNATLVTTTNINFYEAGRRWTLFSQHSERTRKRLPCLSIDSLSCSSRLEVLYSRGRHLILPISNYKSQLGLYHRYGSGKTIRVTRVSFVARFQRPVGRLQCILTCIMHYHSAQMHRTPQQIQVKRLELG
jgi:hypothetical protein